MASEFKKQYPSCLNTIFISEREVCDINWFIQQYIESRRHRRSFNANDAEFEIMAALRKYPGASPVRLFELNAWLDRSFRTSAISHPGTPFLKLIVCNDQISLRN
ncbi:hypothetical protein [Pseudomonas sp. NPDC089569]|uniref:hypothetical protein n=1 Tax=Pseudomonas sp. NPDC089569 TaxID=3390722 RepID=UPI003CFCEF53